MIKSFIISAIKRNIRHISRDLKYIDFQSIKNIVITYDVEDFSNAEDLKATFEREGKSVALFGCTAQKDYSLLPEHGYVMTNRQANLFYFPKVEVVNYFTQIANNSDLLIDITYNNNLKLSYLLSKQKQILKVGIPKKGFNLFDVLIDVEKNVESKFLCEHILFYLRKLKGKA